MSDFIHPVDLDQLARLNPFDGPAQLAAIRTVLSDDALALGLIHDFALRLGSEGSNAGMAIGIAVDAMRLLRARDPDWPLDAILDAAEAVAHFACRYRTSEDAARQQAPPSGRSN